MRREQVISRWERIQTSTGSHMVNGEVRRSQSPKRRAAKTGYDIFESVCAGSLRFEKNKTPKEGWRIFDRNVLKKEQLNKSKWKLERNNLIFKKYVLNLNIVKVNYTGSPSFMFMMYYHVSEITNFSCLADIREVLI